MTILNDRMAKILLDKLPIQTKLAVRDKNKKFWRDSIITNSAKQVNGPD